MSGFLDFFSRSEVLPIGAAAPDLTAPDQDGLPVALRELCARGPVLVFFYLRAGTPVCTMHACRYRDELPARREAGLQILGVSSDPPERLKHFQERRALPYRLLSDADGAIATAFGVRSYFGFPERRAFLIREGRIAWVGRAGDVKNLPPPPSTAE